MPATIKSRPRAARAKAATAAKSLRTTTKGNRNGPWLRLTRSATLACRHRASHRRYASTLQLDAGL